MSDLERTFGARYVELGSVDERLALERDHGRRDSFATVDRVLERIIGAAMAGERVARLVPSRTKKDLDGVELLVALGGDERPALAEHFEVANQERRGSWYLPSDEPLSLGLIHTVHWTRQNPRLALNLAIPERARPAFASAPEAVAVWVVEPLFEDLFLALKLRGPWLGERTLEQQEKSWSVIDPLYAALGIDPGPLDAYRPHTGWSRRTSQDIVHLRQALVESWAHVSNGAGTRYRFYRIGQLVDRYYAKAKNGRALRKQVLTKAFGRTLTAYFGGDWLAFLAYLGEEPHPREEIIQALPETKLMAGSSQRTAEVAAKHGLTPEHVEQMLAAYWQQSDASSPVEQRVKALHRYWDEFDAIHARQERGMPPLWGLVDEYAGVVLRGQDDLSEGPDSGLYRRLLSADLQAEIGRLWGTALLPRWPDRLVTEPFPHASLAQALGPAVRFWHGAALTAWYICEGPYSRTDLDGLANYHYRELDALAELGFCVGGGLFRELRAAEEQLGPEEYDDGSASELQAAKGLSITVSLRMGSGRRAGFELLRDIITRHRREWTVQHLDGYLRAQWESDLRALADTYHRHTADKGEPPSLKQFAKMGVQSANLWFAGDLTGVYGVLGLKAPAQPTRAHRLIPEDVQSLAQRVYERLAGEHYALPPTWNDDPEQRARHNAIDGLARLAPAFVQMEEAKAQPPELKEFGRARFAYRSAALASEPEKAWGIYAEAVHAALEDLASC